MTEQIPTHDARDPYPRWIEQEDAVALETIKKFNERKTGGK